MNPVESRRFKLTRYIIIHNHNTTDLLLVKILYTVQGRLSSVRCASYTIRCFREIGGSHRVYDCAGAKVSQINTVHVRSNFGGSPDLN